MKDVGKGSEDDRRPAVERVGRPHRLRTRLLVVLTAAGGVLSITGGIGLHYVDAIGSTLHRSVEITAPLLSDVLEITQASRRARSAVRAASEQCTGVDAARLELDGFDAVATHVALDLQARAVAVGAGDDVERIAAVERRFLESGRAILASCVRDEMLTSRMLTAGDATEADLKDAFAILADLDETIARTPGLAPILEPSPRPVAVVMARLRSDLGSFAFASDVVSSLGTKEAIDAFAERRQEKLNDLVAELKRLRPTLTALERQDDLDRLLDLVSDLSDRTVGTGGLVSVQRALLEAHFELALRRHDIGIIDDDYFRAVRMLETTARRLDANARREVMESTREAYVVMAGISIVLLVGVLLVAAETTRRVTGPIERFTEHVRRLRRFEDLDRPLDPTLLRRGDEIGVLARAFIQLTGELDGSRRSLEAETEERVRCQWDRLQTAVATMPQGFVLIDADERLVVWNDSLLRMYGLRPGEISVGTPIRALFAHRRAIGACTALPKETLYRRAIEENRPLQRIDEFVDGRVMVVTVSPTADGGAVITYEDITERRRTEAEIEQLARYDAATGLVNRSFFRERITQALIERDDRQVALLYVDLDHFKTVNDALGHSVGDRLLARVAERIVACCGETEAAGRLGGDEFAVLQTRLAQPIAASDLARRLGEAIAEPYVVDGTPIVVGASIGIAVAPDDAVASDALLAHADMALYRAKSEGRGVARFFEPEMDERLRTRRELELDLRGALEKGQFELFYQPVVGARSGRTEGFEALLRWRHPDRGLVSPVDFVPLAEEIGLIGEIGAWVLREATRAATAWPDRLRVAVNISPIQFRTRALPLDVLAALGRSNLRPDRLELEITEGVLLVDTEATLATLAQLRDIGARIAMDDFGTGYSSLGYLRRFTFDKVKIDQSFVRDLGETSDAVAIVRAVTSLCSSLGITTTAEGVETAVQRDRLSQEGCDQFQGWLFGRPMPEAAVADHLAAEARAAEAKARAAAP